MSASRHTSILVSKSSSTENSHIKSKEPDRSRHNVPSRSSSKFRTDSSVSSTGTNNTRQQKRQYNDNINYQTRQRSNRAPVNKNTDKIPRKGQDIDPLLPSERKRGGRRDITNLMNFAYRGSGTMTDNGGSYSVLGRMGKNKRRGGGGYVLDKNQCLQAKSQVILRSGKDYSLHLADPDALFNWEDIEKLNVWSVEKPSCPICLHPATAARITQCGHIYCWSCILRFLHQEKNAWGNCPVCTEPVHANDLRSVGVCEDVAHDRGSSIDMKLMRWTWESPTPMPVERVADSDEIADSPINPAYYKDQPLRNYRYLVATPEQILVDIIEEDMRQLEFELGVETDDLEIPFIEMALVACKERKTLMEAAIEKRKKRAEKLKNKTTTTSTTVAAQEEGSDDIMLTNCTVTSQLNDATNNNNNNHDSSSSSSGGYIMNGIDKSVANLTVTDQAAAAATENSADGLKYFYFYQANDGQHIYLSQINMQCLAHEFGSFEQSPSTIKGQIIQIDVNSIDEKTRREHKYMAYLPLSLKFLVAELDLKPPLLSPETLTNFKARIDNRKEARHQRKKKEDRIVRKAKQAALIRQGKYPPARYQLNNDQQFPGISYSGGGTHSVLLKGPTSYEDLNNWSPTPQQDDDKPQQSSSHHNHMHDEDVASSSSSTSFNAYSYQSANSGSQSFAQMARTVNSGANVANGGGGHVWGRSTTAPLYRSSATTANNPPYYDAEHDADFDPDYVPPPSYQASFVDALWQDPVPTAGTENGGADSAAKNSGGGKKSKKKKKGGKKVLFSTSSRPL